MVLVCLYSAWFEVTYILLSWVAYILHVEINNLNEFTEMIRGSFYYYSMFGL